MTHAYVWRDAFIHVIWLIHMCDMTHSWVWHDSIIPVTLLHVSLYTHSCHMYINSCVWHYWFICVTWLIHTCDFAACVMSHVHSFISHEYTCVLHVYTFMSHVYTFIYMKWPIHMLSSLYEPVTPHRCYSRRCSMNNITLYIHSFFEMTHSYALKSIWTSHARYTYLYSYIASWDTVPSYEWVMSHEGQVTSHIWMRHVTHMDESCHVTRMYESYHTNMNEPCHPYEWVIHCIWMSHATHKIQSWHANESSLTRELFPRYFFCLISLNETH